MYLRDRREGIHQAVSSEVAAIFKGKSLAQLQLLGDQIRKKLRLAATGDLDGATIDVGYWESLLQQLGAHMARTRLRERHQELLKQKLARLKQEVRPAETLRICCCLVIFCLSCFVPFLSDFCLRSSRRGFQSCSAIQFSLYAM